MGHLQNREKHMVLILLGPISVLKSFLTENNFPNLNSLDVLANERAYSLYIFVFHTGMET